VDPPHGEDAHPRKNVHPHVPGLPVDALKTGGFQQVGQDLGNFLHSKPRQVHPCAGTLPGWDPMELRVPSLG
jgi:hypothetical protein